MTKFYLLIQGSLELLLSELLFSDASLQNQYKFVSLNIEMQYDVKMSQCFADKN